MSILTKFPKITRFITALGMVLAISPGVALATAPPGTDQIDLTNLGSSKFTPITQITANKVMVFAINGILIASALAAFFFLLIGGIQWILAGGDKEGTEKARKKITRALIGLAIVFSAYAIAFLVDSIFGISILNFTIPKIV